MLEPVHDTRQPVILKAQAITEKLDESFEETSKGICSWKTLISAPQTATTALTAGIATLPPREGQLCPHRHSHAEIYHIISGRGIMQIDGVEQEVSAGSVVYIPGDAEHGIRNESDEEMKWLYVFGADSFGDVVYRFP